jgi:hypothetical protein
LRHHPHRARLDSVHSTRYRDGARALSEHDARLPPSTDDLRRHYYRNVCRALIFYLEAGHDLRILSTREKDRATLTFEVATADEYFRLLEELDRYDSGSQAD